MHVRDDEQRHVAEVERVAVGVGLHQALEADQPAGAGDVLHHDRLLEQRREALRDLPRQRVQRAAGGDSDDDGDRLAGKALRARQARGERERETEEQASHDTYSCCDTASAQAVLPKEVAMCTM
ncbi:hypothetical protein D3C83_20200 [compost metagenome]